VKTHSQTYLNDGSGVGRSENRRVVINVGDVDVNCNSGGHGRRTTVECLHRQSVSGYLDSKKENMGYLYVSGNKVNTVYCIMRFHWV